MFGYNPVSSFKKRSVYKTEFDIFKRSTEIDLISLVSYDDDPPNTFYKARTQRRERPKTVQDRRYRPPTTYRANNYNKSAVGTRSVRQNSERKQQSKSAIQTSRQTSVHKKSEENVNTTTYPRSRKETDIYRDFAKTSRSFLKRKPQSATDKRTFTEKQRQCQSALGYQDENDVIVSGPQRCSTTCGYRHGERHAYEHLKTKSQNNPNICIDKKTSKFNPSVNTNLVTPVNKASRSTNASCKPENIQLTKSNDTGLDQSNVTDEDIDEFSNILGEDTDNDYEPLNQSLNYQDNHNITTIIVCEDQNSKTTNTVKQTINSVSISEGSHSVWTNEHMFSSTPVQDFTTGNPVVSDIFDSKDSGVCSNFTSIDSVKSVVNKTEELQKNADGTRHVQFEVFGTDKNVDIETVSSNFDEQSVDISKEVNETAYDVDNLFQDLERVGNHSRFSTASFECHSTHIGEDNNSLISERIQQRFLKQVTLRDNKKESDSVNDKTLTSSSSEDFLEEKAMSKEARHAILETLNDMGVKTTKRNKENKSVNNKSVNSYHKSVPSQRRMKDNRSKYDHFMREHSRSVLRNQFKSLDSLGNDENSSQYSSPTFAKECDDSSSEELDKKKLFPSLRENTKLSRTTVQSNPVKTKIYNLEQAKKKNFKIPGIGNYKIPANPDDFEITPPGFDSRYSQRPSFISKEEMEVPPQFIRERSIQKCQSWLTNVNMSPMALKPIKKPKKEHS
ncbi:hypothetical protein MAR_006820 [Mya arenaria]|uniref:Uncharacterized protein n=1 Tax=Mya arenaria TaxID=6604 RepID=A0ABY7D9M3_MYAAR|nr:uncharacterized protein LOC128207325 [Mya arenaria]XP_052766255.1 uncharacterized protein LOC128207325 [Mya arenaria]XP_052766339.1 uncharacterized protein LOC128207325 [Mya arenaria]WAQ94349.1 hypothetical protein MAR_006820 [Mya arenaria]